MSNLKVFRGIDGFRGKVFLDGIQIHYVREILASSIPNDPVEGVAIYIENPPEFDGLINIETVKQLEKTVIGEIFWQPI